MCGISTLLRHAVIVVTPDVEKRGRLTEIAKQDDVAGKKKKRRKNKAAVRTGKKKTLTSEAQRARGHQQFVIQRR